jgi:hypothetical protein
VSARINVTSFDQMMREMFSEKPPQWVLKARAERAELERTGARIVVPPHNDNCGGDCRNVGPATLVADCTTHDCCYFCNERGGE